MMVDTNILIDLREENSDWFEWSMNAVAQGGCSTSAIVVGELASRSGTLSEILEMLEGYEIQPVALTAEVGFRAGLAQRVYREAGGKRDKLLADFLIGAHAEIAGKPLLTRDPRHYRRYFPEITIITPETEQ